MEAQLSHDGFGVRRPTDLVLPDRRRVVPRAAEVVTLSKTIDKLNVPDLSSKFELTRPSWLLGLALVPLVAWYFRRSLVDFPRLQSSISLAARSIIVDLLVLSLAGLTWMTMTRWKYVVLAVDRS
jgi:hypothetical protein